MENLAKQNEAAAERYRKMADDPSAPANTMPLREAARISELNAQLQRDLANRQFNPQNQSSPYQQIPKQPWPGSVQNLRTSNQSRTSIQQKQTVTSNNDFRKTLVIGAVVAGVIFFLALAYKK